MCAGRAVRRDPYAKNAEPAAGRTPGREASSVPEGALIADTKCCALFLGDPRQRHHIGRRRGIRSNPAATVLAVKTNSYGVAFGRTTATPHEVTSSGCDEHTGGSSCWHLVKTESNTHRRTALEHATPSSTTSLGANFKDVRSHSDKLVASFSHRNIGSIGRPRTRIETAQSIP